MRERYGEGHLLGKQTLLSFTTGAHESHFSPRGINGTLNDLLFGFTHGTRMFYSGMDVLPNSVVYDAARTCKEDFGIVTTQLAERLDNLFTTHPSGRFRRQHGGHYDKQLVLNGDLGAGAQGTDIHIASPICN